MIVTKSINDIIIYRLLLPSVHYHIFPPVVIVQNVVLAIGPSSTLSLTEDPSPSPHLLLPIP